MQMCLSLIHTWPVLLLIISHSLFLLCLPCITAHFFPLITLLSPYIPLHFHSLPLQLVPHFLCSHSKFHFFCHCQLLFLFHPSLLSSLTFLCSSDILLPTFCMNVVHFVSLIFFHHLCSVLQSSHEDLQQFSVQFLCIRKMYITE